MKPCGAKTRSGSPCKMAALENGRCRLHGGLSLGGEASPTFKTGRYSKYLKQSLAEKLATVEDENPLDTLPELHMQRALFAEYVSRFSEGTRLQAQDIHYLMGWSAEITRTVERMIKQRNETALTAAEVALIAARIPEVVAKFIHDRDTQKAFINALFGAVGTTTPSDARQLGSGSK